MVAAWFRTLAIGMPLRTVIDVNKTNVAAVVAALAPDVPPAGCVSTPRQM
jgi:hypothetical protein